MSIRHLAFLLVGAMAFAEEAKGLTPAQADAFAWYDSLGYPDVAGKPFVQVWTGRWSQSADNVRRNSCVWGFLLSEEGTTFHVLTVGLDDETFQRKEGAVPAHERVTYVKGDLEKEVRALLDGAKKPKKEEGPSFDFHFGPYTTESVHLFVLARACAANGLDPLARDLYDLGEAAAGATDLKTLQGAVRGSLALAGVWRWTLAFEDPGVPRTRLLEKFRGLDRRFPESEHHDLVKEAVDLMAREWTAYRADPADDTRDAQGLITFLATCGRVEGVQALGMELRKRELQSRFAVVECIAVDIWGDPWPPIAADGVERAIQAARDDVLVALLDDTEEKMGMSGSLGGESISDPRMCDLAAHQLALRWKGKVAFRLDFPDAVRDAAIVALKNVWRELHGLAPLEVPKPPEIPSVAEETISPLLARVSSRVDPEAEAEIEGLGIGALARTRKALAAEDGEEASKRLDRLVARLASLVCVVTLEESAGAFPPAVRDALRGLEGKPLTYEALRGVLAAVAKEAESSRLGLRLVCRRTGDCAGVQVTAKSIVGTGAAYWSSRLEVDLGREIVLDTISGGVGGRKAQDSTDEELSKAVGRVLDATVEDDWRIRLEWVPQK